MAVDGKEVEAVEGSGAGGQEEAELKWAAAPQMEVALVKQTEPDVSLTPIYVDVLSVVLMFFHFPVFLCFLVTHSTSL